MAYKLFALDAQTTITIYKRRSSRNLRLSITPSGDIKVSIPAWTPYKVGLEFARSRTEWIQQQHRPKRQLVQGQQIGKAHHVRFVADSAANTITSRLLGTDIVVRFPAHLTSSDANVQQRAATASVRALRAQARQLLPQRIASLARQHDFIYSNVAIKQLKSRWGSCDRHGAIVLNLYLMQLPWDCIDYVLLHELAHTRVLKHGPEFWDLMRQLIPSLQAVRKAMRAHQPILDSAPAPAVT